MHHIKGIRIIDNHMAAVFRNVQTMQFYLLGQKTRTSLPYYGDLLRVNTI